MGNYHWWNFCHLIPTLTSFGQGHINLTVRIGVSERKHLNTFQTERYEGQVSIVTHASFIIMQSRLIIKHKTRYLGWWSINLFTLTDSLIGDNVDCLLDQFNWWACTFSLGSSWPGPRRSCRGWGRRSTFEGPRGPKRRFRCKPFAVEARARRTAPSRRSSWGWRSRNPSGLRQTGRLPWGSRGPRRCHSRRSASGWAKEGGRTITLNDGSMQ